MVAGRCQRKKEWGRTDSSNNKYTIHAVLWVQQKAPTHGSCSVQQVKHSPQEHKQHLSTLIHTLSSNESVAFRAPSGRPKGKQYL